MPRSLVAKLAKLAIVVAFGISSAGARAQHEPPAPAGPTAEPRCDAVCQLGKALNKKDTPIRSQSGTGGGVVTKVPVEKQTDYRPLDGPRNPDSQPKQH
jgi:hypothetical protein